jgi:hypothetical protein
VRAALALTHTGISTEADAARLFAGVASGRESIEKAIALPKGRFASFDTHDWNLAQAWLREWLPKVAEFDHLAPSTRSALLSDINEKLAVFGELHPRIGPKGLTFVTEQTDTVAGVCLRALIPFLIPNGWPPRRLGRCQFEACGRWFLRPEPKRGSVPQYCDQRHANLARVRAFRQRQEESKQGAKIDPKQPRRDRRRR